MKKMSCKKYLEGFPVMSCNRVYDGYRDLFFVLCPAFPVSCDIYTNEDELTTFLDFNENDLIM